MECIAGPSLLVSVVFSLVVVKRFREPNPNVQQPQPTADPADKSVGNEGSQSRGGHQQMVVCPLRSPRENHKKHADNGADQTKQQHRGSMQPQLEAHIAVFFGMLW